MLFSRSQLMLTPLSLFAACAIFGCSGGSTDESTEVKDASVAVCVLGNDKQEGECEAEDVVDFGTIAAHTKVNKRVVFTVTGSHAITFTGYSITPTDEALTGSLSSAVIYDKVARPLTLPDAILPGGLFYVSFAVSSDGSGRDLKTKELSLNFTGGTTDRIALPVLGSFSGCPAGWVTCEGDNPECSTSIMDDIENCGGCNIKCEAENASVTCENGECVVGSFSGCPAGWVTCEGDHSECSTSIMDDTENCGGCNTKCEAANASVTCENSECVVGSCAAGWAVCDGNPNNGCEVELNSSDDNCGACGVSCTRPNAHTACVAGACVITGCEHPWADCDGETETGCEANLDDLVTNCGACGHACDLPNAEATCHLGVCQVQSCAVGAADCDDDPANGCEAALDTVETCGSCENRCHIPGGSGLCGDGQCKLGSCDPGFAHCVGPYTESCAEISKDPNHCGGCDQRCEDAIPNAIVDCLSGGCVFFGCKPGFYDANGNLDDGCEYSNCTFVSDVDVPDDTHTDKNCDGIVGDVKKAIFLCSENGNDAYPGTMAQPKRTLPHAIATAHDEGKDVYVAAGNYTLTATLVLREGVSMYGGYRPGTWARSDSDVPVITSTATTAMTATGISNPTVIDRVSIRAANATSSEMSSYGLIATNSPGLVIRNSMIIAGNAGAGTAGAAGGVVANSPKAGAAGAKGCENSSGLCSSCSRPQGGAGGTNSSCSVGTAGGRGGNAAHGSGTGFPGDASSGGAAGGLGVPPKQGNCNPSTTYVGKNGAVGAVGSNGAKGSEGYTLSAYAPTHGANGSAGSHGQGAGGGGGGGGGTSSCDSYGGGGGGGGAGGCGGLPGFGGRSGGGSFAVFLQNSDVIIEKSILLTGHGGAGGAGGVGGAGGAGATYGWGGDANRPNAGNPYGGSGSQDDGSNGGRGGWGGSGGHGGIGGGGAGGPSVGILTRGSAPILGGNSFILGAAGPGGASSGNPGPAGVRQEILAR